MILRVSTFLLLFSLSVFQILISQPNLDNTTWEVNETVYTKGLTEEHGFVDDITINIFPKGTVEKTNGFPGFKYLGQLMIMEIEPPEIWGIVLMEELTEWTSYGKYWTKEYSSFENGNILIKVYDLKEISITISRSDMSYKLIGKFKEYMIDYD